MIIICRAREVIAKKDEHKPAAILSIEHPGARPDEKGYAPRVDDVPQRILTFWDSEQPVKDGPDMRQVSEGIDFVLEHIGQGPVIIHCQAGKARSVGVALGVLAVLNPDDSENELIDKLLAIRPEAAPNILVVEMIDRIAGRDGRLLQAVKDHPVLSAQRAKAEENRQNWLKRDPDAAHRMFPEKFPKPPQGGPQ